jgi:hypothetical protein
MECVMSHLSSVPSALQQSAPQSDTYESEIEAVLLALKAAAVRATEKGDIVFYAEYLSEDAIGVTPQGVMTKQQILASLKGGGFKSSKIEDTRAIALSDDAGMVTYRAWFETPEGFSREVFVSTLYRRYADGWKGVFYQQTPLPGDQ